jgi:hypothetical protein
MHLLTTVVGRSVGLVSQHPIPAPPRLAARVCDGWTSERTNERTIPTYVPCDRNPSQRHSFFVCGLVVSFVRLGCYANYCTYRYTTPLHDTTPHHTISATTKNKTMRKRRNCFESSESSSGNAQRTTQRTHQIFARRERSRFVD